MQSLQPSKLGTDPTALGLGTPEAIRSPSSGSIPPHRVLVLYGSRFGNTQRIAEALTRGFQKVSGLGVDCMSIDECPLTSLARYDFIAVGGPTEILSASKPMKAFLSRLPAGELRGKHGFAFDTRLEGRMSGSAGRYIQKHLERLGLETARPHASAIVRGMTKDERAEHGDEGAPEWARKWERPGDRPRAQATARLDLLLPGAEAEFEKAGFEMGTQLAAQPVPGGIAR